MRVWPKIKAYVFILPAAIIYSFFILYSIFQNFCFSLFKWKSFYTKDFIGLGNYVETVLDKVFRIALMHNLIWVGLTLVFPLIAGLILASVLVRRKGHIIVGMIYFIPCTIPYVVSGIIWAWLYHPAFGPINHLLRGMGLGFFAQPWLANPGIALYALNFLGAWTCFGFMTVIFINALESIDYSLYEAAKVDGATDIQRFFYITIPCLKHTIVFLTVWSIIGAMKFFELVYITTDGGPGHATEILSTYIFKLAFRQQQIGHAASIATIMAGIVLALTALLIVRSQRE